LRRRPAEVSNVEVGVFFSAREKSLGSPPLKKPNCLDVRHYAMLTSQVSNSQQLATWRSVERGFDTSSTLRDGLGIDELSWVLLAPTLE
jgi:hypothetical protein